MKRRMLRIAWSVAFSIACAPLIALWIYGYSSGGLPAKWHGHTFRFDTGKLLIDESSMSVQQHVYDANYELGDGTGRWGTPHIINLPIARDTVPAWYPIPFLAAIAAIPWIKWSSRFSLRTLLIATTL